MNYLTRIYVDKKTALGRRFSDSYAWHQALWRLFPGRERQKRDFLSRVDDRGRYYQVFIISNEKPALPEWGQGATKKIALNFLEHGRYRFELRVNPTVKRVVRDAQGLRKKNGRRTAIYDRETLKSWLLHKAEASGFEVESFDTDPPLVQRFWRKGKPGRHIRVDYRGILNVKDQSAFKSAFAKGIGPAKAFGFGMLVLAPLR